MTPSNIYSCLLSAQWDWGRNTSSGKYSATQQVYKYSTLHLDRVGGIEADYPFDVVDTRFKVRGTGRVVVLRYESEEGKDFQLLGFVQPFTAEDE